MDQLDVPDSTGKSGLSGQEETSPRSFPSLKPSRSAIRTTATICRASATESFVPTSALRHGARRNFCFADGHAKNVPMLSIEAPGGGSDGFPARCEDVPPRVIDGYETAKCSDVVDHIYTYPRNK